MLKSRWFYVSVGVLCLLLLIFWLWPSNETLKGNRYTIGRDHSLGNQNLLGKDNNILAFSDQLVQEIATTGEFQIDLVNASTERLVLGLNDGTYDAILLPIVRKPNVQMSRLHFSQPFFALGPVMVLRQDSTITDPEQLKEKSVGIEKGSDLLTKLHKFPNLNINVFDNVWIGLESLANDRIDGLIIDALPAYIYIESLYKGKLKILNPSLTKSGLKLVTLETNRGATLIENFNRSLQELIKDNKYNQLLEKWGLPNYPLPLFEKTQEESLEEQESL